jgi:hypothetical protein
MDKMDTDPSDTPAHGVVPFDLGSGPCVAATRRHTAQPNSVGNVPMNYGYPF